MKLDDQCVHNGLKISYKNSVLYLDVCFSQECSCQGQKKFCFEFLVYVITLCHRLMFNTQGFSKLLLFLKVQNFCYGRGDYHQARKYATAQKHSKLSPNILLKLPPKSNILLLYKYQQNIYTDLAIIKHFYWNCQMSAAAIWRLMHLFISAAQTWWTKGNLEADFYHWIRKCQSVSVRMCLNTSVVCHNFSSSLQHQGSRCQVAVNCQLQINLPWLNSIRAKEPTSDDSPVI